MADLGDFISNPLQIRNPLRMAMERRRRQSVPEEFDPGILQNLTHAGITGASYLGNVLDLPGSSIRDVLAGKNPLDQWAPWNWGTSEGRVSGQDLLRRAGITSRADTWGNWGAGFLAEVVTDPTTYLTFGGSALTKAGKLGKAAGLLGDVTKLRKVGRRQGMMLTTLSELIDGKARGAEGFAEGAASDVLQSTLRRNLLEQAATKAGVKLDDVLDMPLGGVVEPWGPLRFLGGKTGVWGRAGGYGEQVAAGMDLLGKTIAESGPGRFTSMVFDSTVRGLFGKHQQKLARSVTENIRAQTPGGRMAAITESDDLLAVLRGYPTASRDSLKTKGLLDTEIDQLSPEQGLSRLTGQTISPNDPFVPAQAPTIAADLQTLGVSPTDVAKMTWGDAWEHAKGSLHSMKTAAQLYAELKTIVPLKEADTYFMLFNERAKMTGETLDDYLGKRFAGFRKGVRPEELPPGALLQSGDIPTLTPEEAQAPRWYSKARQIVAGERSKVFPAKQLKAQLLKQGVKEDEFLFTDLGTLLEEAGDDKLTKEQVLEAIDNGVGIWEERYGPEVGIDPPLVAEAGGQAEAGRLAIPGATNIREFMLHARNLDIPQGTQWFPGELSHRAQSPNILVRVRTSDLIDENGKKTLVIENLQSDYHMAGRERGYKKLNGDYILPETQLRSHRLSADDIRAVESPPDHQYAVYEISADSPQTFDSSAVIATGRTEQDAINSAMRKWIDPVAEEEAILRPRPELWLDHLGSLPLADAPFKKTWTTLGMKRAIQYAAANGYDQVAWTGGKVQDMRWNTGALQEVNGVEWRPELQQIVLHDSKRTAIPMSADKLREVFGERITGILNRLASGGKTGVYLGPLPEASVSALGLRSSPLSNLYDKQLVNETKKLIKPFNSTVQPSKTVTHPILEQLTYYPEYGAWETGGTHTQQLLPRAGTAVEDLEEFLDPQAAQTIRDQIAPQVHSRSGNFVAGAKAEVEAEIRHSTPLHIFDITPSMRESAIKQGQALYQQEGGIAKGATEFLADGRAIVTAFQSADQSTMLHEIGHVFRRDLSGPELATAQQWAGVGADGVWERAAEEKFARGFERYLRDGTAPTTALAAVFSKFKEWLTRIYSIVTGGAIDVDIPAEMRQVYDSLFTKQQVAPANQANILQQLAQRAQGGLEAVAGPEILRAARARLVDPAETLLADNYQNVAVPKAVEPNGRMTFEINGQNVLFHPTTLRPAGGPKPPNAMLVPDADQAQAIANSLYGQQAGFANPRVVAGPNGPLVRWGRSTKDENVLYNAAQGMGNMQRAKEQLQVAKQAFENLDKAAEVRRVTDELSRFAGEAGLDKAVRDPATGELFFQLFGIRLAGDTAEGLAQAAQKIQAHNKRLIDQVNQLGGGVPELGSEPDALLQYMSRYADVSQTPYQTQQTIKQALQEAADKRGLTDPGQLPPDVIQRITRDLTPERTWKLGGTRTAVDQPRSHETRDLPTKLINNLLEDVNIRIRPGTPEGQSEAAQYIMDNYADWLDMNYEKRSDVDAVQQMTKFAQRNSGRPGYTESFLRKAEILTDSVANRSSTREAIAAETAKQLAAKRTITPGAELSPAELQTIRDNIVLSTRNRVAQHAWELAQKIRSSPSRPLYSNQIQEDMLRYTEAAYRKLGMLQAVHEYVRQNAGEGTGIALDSVFRESGMRDPEQALKYFASQGGVNLERARSLTVPPDVANAVHAVMRSQPGTVWGNEVGRVLDTINSITRGWLTLPFPSFHGRNGLSGLYVNLATGAVQTPADAQLLTQAYRDAWSSFTEPANPRWRTLQHELYAYGVHGRYSGERGRHAYIGAHDVEQPPLANFRNPLLQKVGAAHNRVMQTGMRWLEKTEYANRVPLYLYFRRKGYAPVQAALEVKKRHFDYSELTDIERNLFKRAFLFYSFTRKMAPLMAETLMQRPGGVLSQSIQLAGAAHDKQSRPLPQHVAETAAIPLGESPDSTLHYLTGLGLPQEDVLSFAPSPVQELLSRTTPLIKAPAEIAFGRSLFQRGRPLEDLDPNLGRIIPNVRERLAGIGIGSYQPTDERAKPLFGSQALEFAAANLPTSRFISTLRTLSDPRKDLWKNALQFFSGFKFTDVSPASQDTVLREAQSDALRRLGGRTFTTSYLPEETKATLTPEELQQFAGLQMIQRQLRHRQQLRDAAQ